MLLVDDHEAQAVEGRVLGDERLRANDDVVDALLDGLRATWHEMGRVAMR